MTITITIEDRNIPPGKLMHICSVYLKLRRVFGDEKIHWKETKEKKE